MATAGNKWCATALVVLVCMTGAAGAEVIFSDGIIENTVKFYPDSEDSSLYYYAPAGIEMKMVDGVPAFSFTKFRYIGTRSLGDSGEFRGKGFLGFTVRFITNPQGIHQAQQALQRRLGRQISFKPVPLDDIESDLVYVLTGKDEAKESGTLRGGSWQGDDIGLWEERTYYLSMDPYSTTLLWETFKNGTVALSLNYTITAGGFSERPSQVSAPARVSKPVVTGAFNIQVSPTQYPQLFKETDISGQMPAGYTFLDVYCYDLQDPIEGSDNVWEVLVEVRGHAMNGDFPVEKVSFSADKPQVFKQQVHFRFAVDLNKGYAWRVTRIFGSGRRESSGWREENLWNGMINVSTGADLSAGGKDANPLDPRFLY